MQPEPRRHLLCLNAVNMLDQGGQEGQIGDVGASCQVESKAPISVQHSPQFCSSRPRTPPGIYHAATGGQRQAAQPPPPSSLRSFKLFGLGPIFCFSTGFFWLMYPLMVKQGVEIAPKLDETSLIRSMNESPGLWCEPFFIRWMFSALFAFIRMDS